MTAPSAPTERTRVRRIAELANYQSSTLYEIIDAAYLCHIAFHDDQGSHCIPTVCWRQGDDLYVHGSNGGRMVKLLAQGAQVCVTITHLDGLVLARAAFNHSMNYRSAMIYGQFAKVADEGARRTAVDGLMDRIALGRKAEVRPGNDKEFAATTVLRIALREAACKVRTGGPKDDAADLDVAAWAGVLPLLLVPGAPVAHEQCRIAAPSYVKSWCP